MNNSTLITRQQELLTEMTLLRQRIKSLKKRTTVRSEIDVLLERMYSVRTLLAALQRGLDYSNKSGVLNPNELATYQY